MKMNFSKKALALVMAVLMILSSVSALAFAAPKNNLAAKNEAAIKNVLTVDTSLKTVVGHFGKEKDKQGKDMYTDEARKPYYKNVLYTPDVAHTAAEFKTTFYGSTASWSMHLYYGTNTILVDDGITKPTVPFMLRFWQGYGLKNPYLQIKNLNLTGTSASNFNLVALDNGKMVKKSEWHRIPAGKQPGGHEAGALNFIGTIQYNDINDFSGWVDIPKSENTKSFANIMEFGSSLDANTFYETYHPQFGFIYRNSHAVGGEWSDKTKETDNKFDNNINVVNYKPLLAALNKAQTLVDLVNKNQDLYTNASVKELVRLTNVLLAAKPDKVINDNVNTGVANALSTYANTAREALKAWNDWDQGNVEGGLVKATVDLVDVTSQSFVLDYGNKLSYNINDNAAQKDEAEISYVAYSTSAKQENVKVGAEALIGAETINPGEKIKLNNGEVKLSTNGDLTYKVTNAQFSTPDSIYVLANIKVNDNNNAYKWEKVTFIPANSIYIEDDSAVFKYTGSWDAASPVVDQAIQSAENNGIYGYDDSYANDQTYSAGHARKATLTRGHEASVKFTFTGTGFDVISLASNKTGSIFVDIYEGTDTTKRIDGLFVETYTESYYDGSKWVTDKNNATTLYQIPAIKKTDLPYGTYTVVVSGTYSRTDYLHGLNSCDFYFDGVRIYNPTNDQTALDAYNKDGQANAKYVELNTILGKETITQRPQPGVAIVTDTGALGAVNIANSIGPNHELYLGANQAVTFTVNESNLSKVMVGAKKVVGTPDLNGKAINTTTEMYYEIQPVYDNVYQVANNGDGLLAITVLKATFKGTAPATVALTADTRTVNTAVAYMKAPKADLSINAAAPVVDGKNVTINATTSLDVEALNVTDANGNAVDAKIACTVNGNVKNWTVVITEKTAGTYVYTLSGEYEYGFTNGSASTEVTVTIEEAETETETPAPHLTLGQKIVDFFKKLFGIKF